MSVIVIRFALSLTVLASGSVLFALAGTESRRAKDPALRFLRIPLLPELLYIAIEAAFLSFSIARASSPGFLAPLSECVQFSLGPAYVLFMYRIWKANGLSLSGYPPFVLIMAATLANYAIFFARYPFPALENTIQVINKTITGATMIYAGAGAVIARGKKKDFFPSTKGGFWMAFFSLAYVPFVGLADMFSLAVPALDPGRSTSLQLFPARELVVLAIYALHIEPLYSRLWGRKAYPAEALSAREREVSVLMRKGMTNGEIAEELNVSLATVKTHARSVLRKSGVGSRSDLGGAAASGRGRS